MVSREQLHKEINDAHRDLMHISLTLETIAGNVAYLYRHLGDDLAALAHDMEQARKTIQGHHAQLINLDLQASQRHVADIFTALLEPGPATS
ncbi:hypothetical protein MHM88_14485 [Epibacterium sp. MM17-32]|uniref:hypothetical protein n=1 Tax=Epibacterium sp. MM17-32 TaxID=2917734 RepID=UPI001EF429A8|nr:hypothetical protein [Epibacterium sp. MM17-32]MCG7629015.1 hypothetical protein [Epibacterium sp. MM17-32]